MPLRTVTPKTTRTVSERLSGAASRFTNTAWLGQAAIIDKVLDGKLNNTATVTLAVDPATTTAFSDPRILATSVVLFTPTTASAAAAIETTYVTAAQGSVTFTHAASVAADRTFRIAVFS